MTERPTIRPALQGDAHRLWLWRNDPEVRAASLNPEEIPLERHVAWFEGVLADPLRNVLIAEIGDRAIGMVRLDTDGDTATVSILLAGEVRGQGLGASVLSKAMDTVQPDITRFRAVVKADNLPSLSLFKGLGFDVVGGGDPMVLERKRDRNDLED